MVKLKSNCSCNHCFIIVIISTSTLSNINACCLRKHYYATIEKQLWLRLTGWINFDSECADGK